jgi:hypothetical protein
VVGFVISLSSGATAGIGYGIAFYAISTPIAIWIERRRAQRSEPDVPDES